MPHLLYDYQNDEIVQKFSSNGQTVSVALLDDDLRVLIGAGGQGELKLGHSGVPETDEIWLRIFDLEGYVAEAPDFLSAALFGCGASVIKVAASSE